MAMAVNPEQFIERRVLSPTELASCIKVMRKTRKWTQATLAELARVTERTIQRVENGEPSSLDTRRALAAAFETEDLDFFEKPQLIPNVERWKAHEADLERTTILIPIAPVGDGRTLRTMVESAGSHATHEIGNLSHSARKAFAEIVDSLRDYGNVSELCSMRERLDIDQEIDVQLKKISEEHAILGAGSCRVKLRMKSDLPDLEPMDLTIVYFVLAPESDLPSGVRAPKAVTFE